MWKRDVASAAAAGTLVFQWDLLFKQQQELAAQIEIFDAELKAAAEWARAFGRENEGWLQR